MLEKILEGAKRIGRSALVAGLISLSSVFYCGCEKEYIKNLDVTPQIIELTFDDGPDAVYTPRILDILKEENVKATFFFTGNHMKRYLDVTNRAIREKHLVCDHTTDHSHLVGQSWEKVYNNIMFTQKRIDSLYTILNIPYDNSHKYFRPPWGLISKEQRDSLTKHGFEIVLWDINSMDWSKRYSSDMIIDKVLSEINYKYKSKNKIIVLLHSADWNDERPQKNTVRALRELIEILKAEGKTFETVDEANQPNFLKAYY
jgi:peptidoglycan/xylan/chitin deacetylase (PgdA/CDA1 family)